MKVRFLQIAKRELDDAVYIQENDLLVILAVAHLHRAPDYWIERLPRRDG
jgi:hypothetical protein